MLAVTLVLMVLSLPVLIVLMVFTLYKHALNQIPEVAPVCHNDLGISNVALHLNVQVQVISSSAVIILFYISVDHHHHHNQLVEHSAVFVNLAQPVTSVWMATHGLELPAPVSH